MQDSKNNHGPTAQASVSGDKYGWVALLIAILALVAAVAAYIRLNSIGDDLQNIRGLIENSAASASQAAVESAVAAERADKAERSAALSREYAIQVYPQLNRLGLAIKTPGEEHEQNPQWALDAYEHFEKERLQLPIP